MNFTDIAQALFEFFDGHAGAVFLLSMIFSLLPWLVMLSLLRRFKISPLNKWAIPFAWAFFVLGLLHAFSLLGWTLKTYFPTSAKLNHLKVPLVVVIAICSSGTNYLFFRVGAALNREALGSSFLETIHKKRVLASVLVLAISLLAGLITPFEQWWWTRVPDVLLSTFAVVIVGLALWRNISFRRGRLVTSFALLSAVFYGILFLSYALHPKIVQLGWANWLNVSPQKSEGGPEKEREIRTRKMDRLVIAMSLPLKLGLFFPGYVLMLMIASPARIRELYDKVTKGSAKFLDNHGVVYSMQNEIQADMVELYIKLPRMEKNKAARYGYYRLKMERSKNPEELTFDENTDFGQVLNSGEKILFNVINYPNKFPDGWKHNYSSSASVIVLPILFHNTVVGCLKAELEYSNFNEADMQNMRRFASLLSPAVQDYREADGLNEIRQDLDKISHRLTRLQIEAEEYEISKGLDDIALISCEILAASATGISIEAGFHPYDNMQDSNDPMMKQLREMPHSELQVRGDTEPSQSPGEGEFSYLSEILKIPYNTKEGAVSEQFFGRYVLKTPLIEDKNNLPTLVAKPIHRRAVSNLITEALLNHVRGSLYEVPRELAVALNSLKKTDDLNSLKKADKSVKQDTIQRWLEIVESMATKAGLLWVVATNPKDNKALLGKECETVRKLEEDKSRWVYKAPYKDYANIEAIHLYTPESCLSETTHVIRLSFNETKRQMWFGVGNPNFGLELDYLSPWSGFVHRFGEIADTALQQILDRQEREKAAEEEIRKKIEQERTIIAHDMARAVRKVTSPLRRIIHTIKNLKGEQYKSAKGYADDLSKNVPELEATLDEFSEVGKLKAPHSCSMEDIVNRAVEKLKGELAACTINVNLGDFAKYTVEIPLNIAKKALIVLLQNAIEVPRDGKVRESWIEIWAEEAEGMLLCHVTDNGVGVPQGLRPHILDRPVQSSKDGNGVGLFDSANALQRFGSDIKVTCYGPVTEDSTDAGSDSINMTHGGLASQTTFTLCLKLSPQEELDRDHSKPPA